MKPLLTAVIAFFAAGLLYSPQDQAPGASSQTGTVAIRIDPGQFPGTDWQFDLQRLVGGDLAEPQLRIGSVEHFEY